MEILNNNDTLERILDIHYLKIQYHSTVKLVWISEWICDGIYLSPSTGVHRLWGLVTAGQQQLLQQQRTWNKRVLPFTGMHAEGCIHQSATLTGRNIFTILQYRQCNTNMRWTGLWGIIPRWVCRSSRA